MKLTEERARASAQRRRSSRLRCAGAAIGVLCAAALEPPHPAEASCELLISEYVEGSNANKAIELQSSLDVGLDLAAGGYRLLIHLNGCAIPSMTIPLVGVIPPNGVFVLTHPRASAAILAVANQQDESLWFDGDDAVALVDGDGTVVDVVGQVGFDPGTEWGSDPVGTADNTLRRRPQIHDSDPIGTDPFDPAVEWNGHAADTFDDLGLPNADPSCDVTSVFEPAGRLDASPLRARPNPAVQGSWIGFTLGAPASVRLEVADLAGRIVRVFPPREFPGGSSEIWWDGRDDHGRCANSGVYHVRLKSGETRRRVALVHIARCGP